MALDGAFLHHLKKEIEDELLGAKVDKVFQPNRDEIILQLRKFSGMKKLLISARANTARVSIIEQAPENPKQPPMLCMLLRKRLGGAKLISVSQPELERLIEFKFETINELGDTIVLTLTAEIMGKYSNVILIDEEGKIIDCLKHVDAEMSSERMLLPKLLYRLPPSQNKLCILTSSNEEIFSRLYEIPREMELSNGLLYVLQGVAPLICREAQFYTGHGVDVLSKALLPQQKERLSFFLNNLRDTLLNVSGQPHKIVLPSGKPLEFSFMKIEQYATGAVVSKEESFSKLLENFYGERDRMERMRVKSQDLLKILSNQAERLSRKINYQKAELKESENRDYLRICGDLLIANQHSIDKGATSANVQNFYEESLSMIEIKLNPALSVAQNAQKYYKDYRRAKTAQEKLREQIEHAQEELLYIDTVFDELTRAENENDLSEIRAELSEQGYIKKSHKKDKQSLKKQPALSFTTSDGFEVLVGRNNRSNDELTMKIARNSDVWLHTKNIPGSHTILVTKGREPTDLAIAQAAKIAVAHSKAKDSSQVPVDYTFVKNVSKPHGAKPGAVIYVNYKTIYINQ